MHQIFTSEVPNRDRLGDRRISAVLAIGVFVEQVLPMLHGSSMCLPPSGCVALPATDWALVARSDAVVYQGKHFSWILCRGGSGIFFALGCFGTQ